MSYIFLLNEKVKIEKVNWLLSQPSIHKDPEISDRLKKVLSSYRNSYALNKKFNIIYKHSKDYITKGLDYGRVYPYHKKKINEGFGGLASFKRDIRNFLAVDEYVDVDIKKCHWYIVLWLMKKYEIGEGYNETKKFLENYNNKTFENTETKEKFKGLMFTILNSDNTYVKNSSYLNENLSQFPDLQNVHKIIYEQLMPLLVQDDVDGVNIINKLKLNKKENTNGKFLAQILQNYEFHIIKYIVNAFKNKYNRDVGAVIHDGCLVENNPIRDFNISINEDMESIENDIKNEEEFKNLEIKLEIKPFESVHFEPYNKYLEEKEKEQKEKEEEEDEEKKTPYEILCDKIISRAVKDKLRKDENHIYIQSKLHPMVYNRLYNNNEPETITQFIEDVFRNDKLFRKNAIYYDQIHKFILKRNIFEFQTIKYSTSHIAFKNGVYDIDENEFILLKDIPTDTNIISRKYIDQDLDIDNIDTPLFDNALLFQLKDAKILNILYVLTGRLFYSCGNDGLDVIMFIRGRCSTFKSCFLKCITAMLRPGVIGTLNSTTEKTFKLESLMNKEIILAPDLPKDLQDILPDDLFKAMADGGMVSISKKNKIAVHTEWKIPAVFVSQHYPNYNDDGNAIDKRLAIFDFNTKVPKEKEDPDLVKKIIKKELPAIIYKCIKRYRHYIKKNNGTFQKNRLPYFEETIRSYRESVSSLSDFLNKDPSKYAGMIYSIEYGNNYSVSLNEFMKNYTQWGKFNKVKVDKVLNEQILNDFNLTKGIIRHCSFCKKLLKSGCCSQYNPSKRKQSTIIKGLQFKVEKDYDDENNMSDYSD